MKEQLYEIPVNDAFDSGCECPICKMYKTLEEDAIEYTMGSSYMQEDVRAHSDKLGFCPNHLKLMYANGNRLGLALMLDTHYRHFIEIMKKKSGSATPSAKSGFFKKSQTKSAVTEYVHNLENTCFVCDHIDMAYPRYIHTIYYLWKNDLSFRDKFKSSKGFCLTHYALLYDVASDELKDSEISDFISDLNKVFFVNIDRVHEDISWFIEKYDYRNKDKPWKESKDALQRGVLKLGGGFVEE